MSVPLAGDTRQIEQIADKMLALDPASEDAVKAKMEVLAFAGDRERAVIGLHCHARARRQHRGRRQLD